jgi:uncharacterized protein
MNDLLDRLKSLGLIIPTHKIETRKKQVFPPLEEYFDGVWINKSQGKVFYLNSSVSYGSDFGIIRFQNNFSTKAIIKLLGLDLVTTFSLKNIVFLDIETTNLSIGSGSFAFLVGLCYFTKHNIQTNLFFIEDPIDEPALLDCLDDELSKFDVISSYNGKSFDIPLLRNRFIMQKITSDCLQKTHIDLLHVSRKIWKARINNCRLADIEREILKYSRSDVEIPGWLVPQIYFDFLKQKNPQLLNGVFYHNKIDVLSLAALFQNITLSLNGDDSIDTLEGLDLTSIGQIYQKLGQKKLSQTYYDLGLKKGVDNKNTASVHKNLGLLKKKHLDWDGAIYHWKIATTYNDLESCIELAKYYEHNLKNYLIALVWTTKANLILNLSKKENLSKIKVEEKIIHRKNRLLRKIKTIER